MDQQIFALFNAGIGKLMGKGEPGFLWGKSLYLVPLFDFWKGLRTGIHSPWLGRIPLSLCKLFWQEHFPAFDSP